MYTQKIIEDTLKNVNAITELDLRIYYSYNINFILDKQGYIIALGTKREILEHLDTIKSISRLLIDKHTDWVLESEN